MNLNEKIKKIADHYGAYTQSLKLAEECSEFSAAFLKLVYFVERMEGPPKDLNPDGLIKRQEEARKRTREELADVLLVARQIEYLLAKDESWKLEVEALIEAKADRQLRRIEEEGE